MLLSCYFQHWVQNTDRWQETEVKNSGKHRLGDMWCSNNGHWMKWLCYKWDMSAQKAGACAEKPQVGKVEGNSVWVWYDGQEETAGLHCLSWMLEGVSGCNRLKNFQERQMYNCHCHNEGKRGMLEVQLQLRHWGVRCWFTWKAPKLCKNSGILVAPPLLLEDGILSEPLSILLGNPFTAVSGFLAISSCHLALGVAGRERHRTTS